MFDNLLNLLPVEAANVLKYIDVPGLPSDFATQFISEPKSTMKLFLDTISQDPQLAEKCIIEYKDTVRILEDGVTETIRDYVFTGVYGVILSVMIHAVTGHGLSLTAEAASMLPIFDLNCLSTLLMFIF